MNSTVKDEFIFLEWVLKGEAITMDVPKSIIFYGHRLARSRFLQWYGFLALLGSYCKFGIERSLILHDGRGTILAEEPMELEVLLESEEHLFLFEGRGSKTCFRV